MIDRRYTTGIYFGYTLGIHQIDFLGLEAIVCKHR